MKHLINKLKHINKVISCSYINFQFNINIIDSYRLWLTPSVELSWYKKGIEITIYFLFSYLYINCGLKNYLNHES